MKLREFAALLRLLDKHPQYTDVTFGDVRVLRGDAPLAPADTGTPEDRDESLELPPGIVDPRDKIREIYRKANLRRDGKVPS